MAIDRSEVRRIARLACLELDEATIDSLTRDLDSILDQVALLDELDAPPVEPGSSHPEAPADLREDAERPSLSQEQALRNAPDRAAGFFRVPRVLGE